MELSNRSSLNQCSCQRRVQQTAPSDKVLLKCSAVPLFPSAPNWNTPRQEEELETWSIRTKTDVNSYRLILKQQKPWGLTSNRLAKDRFPPTPPVPNPNRFFLSFFLCITVSEALQMQTWYKFRIVHTLRTLKYKIWIWTMKSYNFIPDILPYAVFVAMSAMLLTSFVS